jgi:hypothetical protein
MALLSALARTTSADFNAAKNFASYNGANGLAHVYLAIFRGLAWPGDL